MARQEQGRGPEQGRGLEAASTHAEPADKAEGNAAQPMARTGSRVTFADQENAPGDDERPTSRGGEQEYWLEAKGVPRGHHTSGVGSDTRTVALSDLDPHDLRKSVDVRGDSYNLQRDRFGLPQNNANGLSPEQVERVQAAMPALETASIAAETEYYAPVDPMEDSAMQGKLQVGAVSSRFHRASNALVS